MTTGADQGEIAEVGSPIDVPSDPAEERGRPLRWTSTTIAVAAVLLALGNAGTMASWLDELPPGVASDGMHDPLAAWVRITGSGKLDAPYRIVHRGWNAARALRFGTERPGYAGTH